MQDKRTTAREAYRPELSSPSEVITRTEKKQTRSNIIRFKEKPQIHTNTLSNTLYEYMDKMLFSKVQMRKVMKNNTHVETCEQGLHVA